MKCYECNSLENEDCAGGENLPDKYLKPCIAPHNNPTAVSYCRKIDQTGKIQLIDQLNFVIWSLLILVNNKKSVVRSCGVGIGTKECYKTAGTNSVCTLIYFMRHDRHLFGFWFL